MPSIETGKILRRPLAKGRPAAVVAAGLASLLVGAFCFWAAGLFPFGRLPLASGEGAVQLAALAASVREYGVGYSLSFALGMDNTAMVLRHLVGPFSLLLLLLPAGQVLQALNLMVLLEIIAAACAATLLLTSEYAPFRPGNALGAVLGLLYAFGGFALVDAAGSMDMLDLGWLLPLCTLALGRLARDGKTIGLVLTLTALLYCAPGQAAFLLPLFLLFAGVYLWWFADPGAGAVLALRLAVAGGAAALLAAPSWVAILAARGNDAGGFATQFDDLQLFEGSGTRLLSVLAGGLVLAALALVVWARLYRQPRVRFLLLCFGVSLLPLVFAPMAGWWGWLGGAGQAGLYALPGWLGLLLLAAVAELLYRRPQRPAPGQNTISILATNLGMLVVFGLYVVLSRYGQAAVAAHVGINSLNGRWLLAFALVFALVVFILCLLRATLELPRQAFALGLAVAVGVCCVYSGLVYLVPVNAATQAGQQAKVSAAATLQGAGGTVGGRVKAASASLGGNALGAGWYSLGGAAGVVAEDVLYAAKKLGYSGYGIELSGYGGTILSDALLNISAVAGQDGTGESPLADALYTRDNTTLASAGGYTLTATPAAAGWGTVVYATPEQIATIPGSDRFTMQDWLYTNLFGGAGQIMRRYDATRTEGVKYELYEQADRYGVWQAVEGTQGVLEYVITVGQREALYFDCFRFLSTDLDEIVNDGLAVWVNGEALAWPYPTREANGLLYLGTYEDETVEIRIDLLRSELVRSFGVAGILEADVQAALMALPPADGAITGGGMELTVPFAEAGALLVLPVAYAPGLAATLNGEDVPVYKVLDGLAAVELAEGESIVQLRYNNPVLLRSLLIALPGLVILLWLGLAKGRVLVGPMPENMLAPCKAARVLVLLGALAAALLLVAVPLALWAARGVLVLPAPGV